MSFLSRVVLVSAIVSLSACVTNPDTGRTTPNKAVTYGGAAAVLCGIIGSTESSKRARNAALGCGIVGAGIGAYMDAQEKKLREELSGTGVRIERDGHNIHLIMPGNITFNTDSFSLRSSFYPVLSDVAKVVSKYHDTHLQVVGYTDSTGKREYNQTLSENRARSVAAYLEANGVAGSRLDVEGLGQNSPIADNKTDAGRAANRRVELSIVPTAS